MRGTNLKFKICLMSIISIVAFQNVAFVYVPHFLFLKITMAVHLFQLTEKFPSSRPHSDFSCYFIHDCLIIH